MNSLVITTETTGLQPTVDRILEVGIGVVDISSLELLACEGIPIQPPDLEKAISRMPEDVADRHLESGLLEALAAGEGVSFQDLPDVVSEINAECSGPLIGHNLLFHVRFLQHWWPTCTSKILKTRTLDVQTLIGEMTRAKGAPAVRNPSAPRAADRIVEIVKVLAQFRKRWLTVPTG